MKAKNDFKMYVRALFWMPFCFCSLFMCFQSPPVTIHQAVPSLHPAYPARSRSSILIKLVQGLLHCVKNFMLSMLRFAGCHTETVSLPVFCSPKVSSVSTNKLVYFKSSAKTRKDTHGSRGKAGPVIEKVESFGN